MGICYLVVISKLIHAPLTVYNSYVCTLSNSNYPLETRVRIGITPSDSVFKAENVNKGVHTELLVESVFTLNIA